MQCADETCSKPPARASRRSMRNHAYLVFDTLYGIDTSWAARGNRYVRPTATAPHLDSTNSIDLSAVDGGQEWGIKSGS